MAVAADRIGEFIAGSYWVISLGSRSCVGEQPAILSRVRDGLHAVYARCVVWVRSRCGLSAHPYEVQDSFMAVPTTWEDARPQCRNRFLVVRSSDLATSRPLLSETLLQWRESLR
jgi:hypothetical protein